MDRRTVLQILAATSILGVAVGARAGSSLVVVVNPKNPVRSIGAGDIETIFTTRKLDWPSGQRVVPFNFPARHPLREAFDRAALHLDPDEAARYWIDRRIRGGHPPPRQVPDMATMIRVVASLETAIGYVYREEVDGSVRAVGEV